MSASDDRRLRFFEIARLAAFVAILAGGFQWRYLTAFSLDRSRTSEVLAEFPYRRAPGLRRLCSELALRTPAGARIALFVPMRHWDEGYAYAYIRAKYLLAGREVLPLVDPHDRLLLENLDHVDYLAAWHAVPQFPGFVEVWRSEDGVLWRKSR